MRRDSTGWLLALTLLIALVAAPAAALDETAPPPDITLTRSIDGDRVTSWSVDPEACAADAQPQLDARASRLVLVYPEAPTASERDRMWRLVQLLASADDSIPVDLITYGTDGPNDVARLSPMNLSIPPEASLCFSLSSPHEDTGARVDACAEALASRFESSRGLPTMLSSLTLSTYQNPAYILRTITEGLESSDRLDADAHVIMIGDWTTREAAAIITLPEAHYTLLAPALSRPHLERPDDPWITSLHLPRSVALLHGDVDPQRLSCVVFARARSDVDHHPPRRVASAAPHSARRGHKRRCRDARVRSRRFNESAFFGTLLCWYLVGAIMMIFVGLVRRP